MLLHKRLLQKYLQSEHDIYKHFTKRKFTENISDENEPSEWNSEFKKMENDHLTVK